MPLTEYNLYTCRQQYFHDPKKEFFYSLFEYIVLRPYLKKKVENACQFWEVFSRCLRLCKKKIYIYISVFVFESGILNNLAAKWWKRSKTGVSKGYENETKAKAMKGMGVGTQKLTVLPRRKEKSKMAKCWGKQPPHPHLPTHPFSRKKIHWPDFLKTLILMHPQHNNSNTLYLHKYCGLHSTV